MKKKKAFTLAETLLALGIIGIIAAILAPVLTDMRPDHNKVIYLKAYDTLTESVQTIVNDTSIYPPLWNNGSAQYNVSRYPLLNNEQSQSPAFSDNKYSGSNKLGYLIADIMDGDSSSGDQNGVSFTTEGGTMAWQVKEDNTWSAANQKWSNLVTVNIEGDTSMPKLYGQNGYTDKPTTFQFCITASGNVIPLDAYGQMYAANRQDLKKDKNEKNNVKKYGTASKDISVPISHIQYED